MISNAVYIAEYLTPNLLAQLQARFGSFSAYCGFSIFLLQNLINHTVPDLEDLKKRVLAKSNDIKTSFITVKARDIVYNKLNWENSTYPEVLLLEVFPKKYKAELTQLF